MSDLWTQAAAALTGRPVIVRWQRPSITGRSGECWKRLDGKIIIDIKPGLSEKTALYVLCHEAAHGRLHSQTWKAQANVQPDSDYINLRIYNAHPVVKRIESEADSLSAQWLEFAESNFTGYTGQTDLEKKLTALADYYNPIKQPELNQAINRGVAAALKKLKVR